MTVPGVIGMLVLPDTQLEGSMAGCAPSGVTAMISFEAPGSGLFHPGFSVRAKFSDPAMAKFVEKLDEGAKVKSLKGRVHYDADFFMFFELKGAQLKVK